MNPDSMTAYVHLARELGKGDLVLLNKQYWHGVDLRKCMRAQGEHVKLMTESVWVILLT